MNKNQRIVLGLGLLLLVLNGLFPPFEAEIRGEEKDWPTTTRHLGYHLLFSPPSHEDVLGKSVIQNMYDLAGKMPTSDGVVAVVNQVTKSLDSIRVNIAMSYFIVQIVTIVSLTTGACILFRRSSAINEGK
jgi:hypothetical protein